jgi:hypothetical protein
VLNRFVRPGSPFYVRRPADSLKPEHQHIIGKRGIWRVARCLCKIKQVLYTVVRTKREPISSFLNRIRFWA